MLYCVYNSYRALYIYVAHPLHTQPISSAIHPTVGGTTEHFFFRSRTSSVMPASLLPSDLIKTLIAVLERVPTQLSSYALMFDSRISKYNLVWH